MPRISLKRKNSDRALDEAPPKRAKKWCTCWRYCKGGRARAHQTWLAHAVHRDAQPEGVLRKRSLSPEDGGDDMTPNEQLPDDDSADDLDAVRSPSIAHEFRSPSLRLSIAPESPSRSRGHTPELLDHSDDDLGPDIGSNAYDEAAGGEETEELAEPGAHLGFEFTDLPLSHLPDLAILQRFNQLLRCASYDNCDLTADQLDSLLHPSQDPVEFDETNDRLFLLCLRTYMTCSAGSYQQYTEQIENMRRAYPGDSSGFLSLAQMTRRLERLTGVVSVMKDMCIDSCAGFTGPWSELDACPICQKARYGDKGKPVKQFSTILLPQQVQALRRHPESARDAQYIWRKLQQLEDEIEAQGYVLEYDDVVCGSEIRDAVMRGHIRVGDTVVMITIDGAQLYRNKASDCWMYGWIILNYAPDRRYKQRYLLPGGFIGGPNKPKIFESFLHPGLHIVSAVNNAGGLPVWDAHLARRYLSKLFIAYGLADGPGMTAWSSLVPHHGKIGCRLWCGMSGRHKPDCPHYYPATLKPDNYTVSGSDHPDVDPSRFRGPNKAAYAETVQFVTCAPSKTQYKERRRETGITGTSPFMGLAPDTVIGAPSMFPQDIMHASLNWGDLLLSLWRGTLDCEDSDSRHDWDFAIFMDASIWKRHGEDVAWCTQFIPGLFGRPPRNIAEKLNSGYKAWEFVLYLWRLGPGLLLGVLPPKYWRCFCKLVAIIRFCEQKQIPFDEILGKYKLSLEFIREFEELYYRRRTDRLHFIRPIVHNLSHMVPEILRVGPAPCTSQWTMERFIGLVTADLKQDSSPYANLAARGLERARLNAVRIMLPDVELASLAAKRRKPRRGGKDLGDGYILLRAKEPSRSELADVEVAALRQFLVDNGVILGARWVPFIQRWARLQLPNGQIVRTAWKELCKAPGELRRARDIRLSFIQGQTDYAEVRYYFQYNVAHNGEPPNIRTLAMVSVCTRPDAELLAASCETLWSCKHQGDAGLRVVDYTAIQALVGLCPHSRMLPATFADRVLVVDMPGLAVAELGDTLKALVDEMDCRGNDNSDDHAS